MQKQTIYRWVKASERLPGKAGVENSVILKVSYNNRHCATIGFKTFDTHPKMYFEHRGLSFATNEGVEWLEEYEAYILSEEQVADLQESLDKLRHSPYWQSPEDVNTEIDKCINLLKTHQ